MTKEKQAEYLKKFEDVFGIKTISYNSRHKCFCIDDDDFTKMMELFIQDSEWKVFYIKAEDAVWQKCPQCNNASLLKRDNVKRCLTDGCGFQLSLECKRR